MSLTRRRALAGVAGLAAGPAFAAAPAPKTAPEVTIVMARDEAPPASDLDAWTGYEARLRGRLSDAGGGRFDDAGARDTLAVVNAARAAAGAPPLAWHDELALAARAHGGDLAHTGRVEHLSPEGFDPSHRLWLLGRTTIGSPTENLAYHRQKGPPVPPSDLLAQWRRSPEGHWQNLMRPSHTHAAFALVRGSDQALLVGLFVRPLATLPTPLPWLARGVEIAEALRALDADLAPRLAPPQGARRGDRPSVDPATGVPVRRVMQISALRRDDGGYVGGPVFLPSR